MPIREFNCKECDAVTELLVRRAADEKNVTCGSCGSRKVKRMLSVPSVAVAASSGTPEACTSCREAPSCPAAAPYGAPPCAR